MRVQMRGEGLLARLVRFMETEGRMESDLISQLHRAFS